MDKRRIDKRRLDVVVALLLGVANAALLTSCILVVPDTRSHRHVRIELPVPAKNPTVSYMDVDLAELSCDQLAVVQSAIPTTRGASDGNPREWQRRRRVREIEAEMDFRCSPLPEFPVAPLT